MKIFQDELLYEYNYGLDDDDYEDQDENEVSKPLAPPGALPKENTFGVKDHAEDEHSHHSVVIKVNGDEESNKQISRTFFVTLIAGSAVITFITLMLAFYIYRYSKPFPSFHVYL